MSPRHTLLALALIALALAVQAQEAMQQTAALLFRASKDPGGQNCMLFYSIQQTSPGTGKDVYMVAINISTLDEANFVAHKRHASPEQVKADAKPTPVAPKPDAVWISVGKAGRIDYRALPLSHPTNFNSDPARKQALKQMAAMATGEPVTMGFGYGGREEIATAAGKPLPDDQMVAFLECLGSLNLKPGQ